MGANESSLSAFESLEQQLKTLDEKISVIEAQADASEVSPGYPASPHTCRCVEYGYLKVFHEYVYSGLAYQHARTPYSRSRRLSKAHWSQAHILKHLQLSLHCPYTTEYLVSIALCYLNRLWARGARRHLGDRC